MLDHRLNHHLVSLAIDWPNVARHLTLPAGNVEIIRRWANIFSMFITRGRSGKAEIPTRKGASPKIAVQQLNAIETPAISAKVAPETPAFRGYGSLAVKFTIGR